MTYTSRFAAQNGVVGGLTLTRRIGAGGEAEVWEVAERSGLAFKCYRVPTTPERAAKLAVMLAHPPEGTAAGGHVAIAWPVEVVGTAGFLMPRIDTTSSVPLFQVYNPASRRQVAPAFTWRYLLRTARNVAAIVDRLHRAGYVVGDLNESNLLVSPRALVTLVDCDSMQVRDPSTGMLHRSAVAKVEFTAPELHRRDLSTTDRSVATDGFALAVLVHLLLLEGVHPFAGVWQGVGEPPDLPERIRRGAFAHRRGSGVALSPYALGLGVLPRRLRRLTWRAFTSGRRRPTARPSAADWVTALDEADATLVDCPRSSWHVYPRHLKRACPWCARIDAGLPDPFPGPPGSPLIEPRAQRRSLLAAIAHRFGGLLPPVRRVVGGKARLVPLAAGLTIAGGAAPWAVPVLTAAVGVPLTAVAAGLRWRELPRLARRSMWDLRLTAPAASALAVAATTIETWGVPPVEPTAALAAALVTVAHGVVAPRRLPDWPEAGGRHARAPIALAWLVGLAAAAFGLLCPP